MPPVLDPALDWWAIRDLLTAETVPAAERAKGFVPHEAPLEDPWLGPGELFGGVAGSALRRGAPEVMDLVRRGAARVEPHLREAQRLLRELRARARTRRGEPPYDPLPHPHTPDYDMPPVGGYPDPEIPSPSSLANPQSLLDTPTAPEPGSVARMTRQQSVWPPPDSEPGLGISLRALQKLRERLERGDFTQGTPEQVQEIMRLLTDYARVYHRDKPLTPGSLQDFRRWMQEGGLDALGGD